MRSLFQIMLPVALGSFVTNLTSLIDLCTMMRCFDHLQQTQAAALFQKFGAVAAESTFPALVYGAFSGMALTVFNLVPSVTNMFGKSVLPCAAQSWAKGQKEAVQKQLAICSVFNSTDCTSSSWRIVLSVRFYLNAALSGTGNRLPPLLRNRCGHCCRAWCFSALPCHYSAFYRALAEQICPSNICCPALPSSCWETSSSCKFRRVPSWGLGCQPVFAMLCCSA